MIAIKEEITFQDFYKVLFENKKISWDSSIQDRVEESFTFLQEFAKNKVIYGVNTGFRTYGSISNRNSRPNCPTV